MWPHTRVGQLVNGAGGRRDGRMTTVLVPTHVGTVATVESAVHQQRAGHLEALGAVRAAIRSLVRVGPLVHGDLTLPRGGVGAEPARKRLLACVPPLMDLN